MKKNSYIAGCCDTGQGVRIPLGIKFYYSGTEENAKKWLKRTTTKYNLETAFGGLKLYKLVEVDK